MRILILGASAVQADAIEYLKENGHETFCIAKACDGRAAYISDHFEKIDFSSTLEVIKYIRANKIEAVYSVGSDAAMPKVEEYCEMLALRHFNSQTLAKTCNDKPTLRLILGDDFKGNVSYMVASNIEELSDIKFPVIIKPADSQGQRGVFLIKNREELCHKFNRVKQFSKTSRVILEEYIEGDEISFVGYVIDNEVVLSISTDRVTWPKYLGRVWKHVVPSKISQKALDSVDDLVKRIVNKIGIKNGIIYSQIKIRNDEAYVIEFTPRFDGCHLWKLLKYSSGIDLLDITFKHLLDGVVPDKKIFQNLQFKPYVLEFLCQQPMLEMNLDDFKDKIDSSLEYSMYYENNDIVRPINGLYDKVGYVINKL